MKYDNDVWFAGTLTEFNATTGEWVAVFDSDNDTMHISFPDENVHLL